MAFTLTVSADIQLKGLVPFNFGTHSHLQEFMPMPSIHEVKTGQSESPPPSAPEKPQKPQPIDPPENAPPVKEPPEPVV